MQSDLHSSLLEIGFKDKEAIIYLVVLELGGASAATIARVSGIKRITTYSIIQNMIIKNYLKEIEKNNVKIFSVIDPEILLKEFEKKSSKFRDLLPEFSLLTDNRGNKPKVEYFEGIEGIKSMYDDTLLIEGTVLKAFMGTQNMDPDLVEYFYSTYVPKRVKRNIKAFVILPSSDLTQKYVSSSDKELLKETITISHETFFIADEINLYGGDKVSFAMYSPDEMFGILVKSKKLHDTLVGIFDHLRWIYTDGGMSK